MGCEEIQCGQFDANTMAVVGVRHILYGLSIISRKQKAVWFYDLKFNMFIFNVHKRIEAFNLAWSLLLWKPYGANSLDAFIIFTKIDFCSNVININIYILTKCDCTIFSHLSLRLYFVWRVFVCYLFSTITVLKQYSKTKKERHWITSHLRKLPRKWNKILMRISRMSQATDVAKKKKNFQRETIEHTVYIHNNLYRREGLDSLGN